MSITQNLVSMMNGEILVESEPGKGSVFTIRLPQGNTGAPALGRETVEQLRQFRSNYQTEAGKIKIVRKPINSGRVLIVDDMEMNLYVAEDMLSPYGMRIDTAFSGHEAIEKIKINTYDIVFMDHMMPGMDGTEAIREIRKLGQKYEKLPIVALTANVISGIKEMFIANGFNDFMAKPIRIQDMNEILKKWMPPGMISSEKKD